MKLNLIITVGQIGSSLAQKWSSCSGWVLIRSDCQSAIGQQFGLLKPKEVSCGEGFKCWFDRGVPVCERCTVPCKAPITQNTRNSEKSEYQPEYRPFASFSGGRMFLRVPESEIKLKQDRIFYEQTILPIFAFFNIVFLILVKDE